jgi:phosphatidate cytidylyltransferase
MILATIILFEWKHFYHPRTIQYWLYLPVYPTLPFVLIMFLNHAHAYRPLLFYLFVLAFTNDTGAYLAGSLFGRHKIWPSISPKKTWEGFFGGYIVALIGLYVIFWKKGMPVRETLLPFFVLGVCILLFLGDIFESKLKRRAGIKDSGTLLPGHGGFLDRFDGILCAACFFYLFRDWLILFLL